MSTEENKQVLSIHEVELYQDADEHEFQRVVFDEVAPFYRSMGWEVRLLKGDRGARDGKYLLIFEIATPAERDRWVPTPGNLSEEGEQIFATWGPVWEKINKLATILFDPEFTDYVMVKK